MASENITFVNRPLGVLNIPDPNARFLKIDYSKTTNLPVGQHISSPTFSVGGFDFYPQGQIQAQGSHVALYLRRLRVDDVVATRCSYQVLTKTGHFRPLVRDAVGIYQGAVESAGFMRFLPRDRMEDFISDKGILLISASITVLTESKVGEKYPQGLFEHIEKLWLDGKISDVTFEVGGESISAHRIILASRSPVFEAQLFGSMADSKTECIKIKDVEARVFKALLEFIYTDRLAINESNSDEASSIKLLQGLFQAANKYSLEKLTILCVEKLGNNSTIHTVASTLLLADLHRHAELKNKCLDFLADPEHFSLVALTDEFMDIKQVPSLYTELCEKVMGSSRLVAKRPRIA